MTKLRAVLKRRWMILVICLILGSVGGVLSSQLARDETSKLFTAQQVIVANSSSGATSLVSQDMLKITRGEVPRIAAEKLGRPQDADALAATIDPLFDAKSSSITVASNDADPDEAQRRVEAFVEAFVETTNASLQSGPREQLAQVEEDLKTATTELATFETENPELSLPGANPSDLSISTKLAERQRLQNRIDDLTADVRARRLDLLRNLPYDTLGPETPRPAQSGLIDVPASKTARATLLGFLGLLLGSGLVMLIERLNRRIDTREELVEVTDIPILAEIGFVPERRRAVDASGQVSLSGVWAEPYRRVRSAIQFVQAHDGTMGPASSDEPNGAGQRPTPSVFLVTSTSPAEGKSTTAALVALALAEVAVPTVLIGGDFRKPQIDRLVGAKRSPSLQDLATLTIERPTVDEVVQTTQHENLYVAVAGEPTREVTGLVEAAKQVCYEAVARGGTVIVDSSPLQAANDTLDLLPAVDYVIIVVRVGRSGEADLLDTIATLRRMDSRLLGIVLIGTPAGRKQEYYYDYYSHGPAVVADASQP